VTGASNDGWEDSAGSIISSKAGFAHTGAVVNDKSSNLVITHLGGLLNSTENNKIYNKSLLTKIYRMITSQLSHDYYTMIVVLKKL
jgi:hypothetical protein